MNTPDSFVSLKYHVHGDPMEVIHADDVKIDQCLEGEVIIKLEAATIHPSDLGLIAGTYGNLKKLPAVAGREGVGVIYETGPGVDEKIKGRPVLLPEHKGAWQEFHKEKVQNLLFLPSLVPFDQLAVSIINPMTAWRLLNDFEYLKAGDFVIQNAGNSAVGLSVIQFAKIMGLRCISLVRTEGMQKMLKEQTDSDVFLDNDEVIERVTDITDGKKCMLGLNSIGGRSALRIARCLCDGGVHVTFGAMDSTSIRFPTRSLIFNDIRFVGFWLDRWRRKKSINELRVALDDVLQPLALTQIKHQIDSIFKLEDFKDGLRRNSESRLGKVLLVSSDSELLKTKDSVA
jgi:NADPH:quinone reductase-like Zn-dependent oxidoreductase